MSKLDLNEGLTDTLSADSSFSGESTVRSELEIQESIRVDRLKTFVAAILEAVGEDINREGLLDTPERVAKSWVHATDGYAKDVKSILCKAIFHMELNEKKNNELVLVRDVEFASLSESNLLPFFGRCHLAYVPRDGHVLGLSKVARLVKTFARRVQSPERLADDIVCAFQDCVRPLGCAIIIDASHLTIDSMRAVYSASTSGCFQQAAKDTSETNTFVAEFLCMLNEKKFDATIFEKNSCGVQNKAHTDFDQSNKRMVAVRDSMISVLKFLVKDLPLETITTSAEQYASYFCRAVSGLQYTLPPFSLDRQAIPATNHDVRRAHSLSGGESARTQDFVCVYSPQDNGEGSSGRGAVAQQKTNLHTLDLSFSSHCEHHLIPFYGRVKVCYVLPEEPGRCDCVESNEESMCDADVSEKCKRSDDYIQDVVLMYSRRPQIQELLTEQIAQRFIQHQSQFEDPGNAKHVKLSL